MSRSDWNWRTGHRSAKSILLILFFVLWVSFHLGNTGWALQPKTWYYVSTQGNDSWSGTKPAYTGTDGPFRTLTRAQSAVRAKVAAGLTGDVVVFIRGGRYEISAPLQFTSLDTGTSGFSVAWAAYQGETPIISGGKKLTGAWVSQGNNVWTMTIPEVASGQWWFRQLTSGGVRQTRARFPNAGQPNMSILLSNYDANNPSVGPTHVYLNQDFNSSGYDLSQQGMELVVFNLWAIDRAKVYANDVHTVSTSSPLGCQNHSLLGGDMLGKDCYLENCVYYVDQPGEWHLSPKTGLLTYKAPSGQNPNAIEWIAPTISQLIAVQGTSAQPVRNLQFIGLQLRDTAWEIPQGAGYNEIQAGMYANSINLPWNANPVGIRLTQARNCRFEKCGISHFGAGAIGLGEGCQNNTIIGCDIGDIGGNGVMIGYPTQPFNNWTNYYSSTSNAPVGNTVMDNRIHDCGVVQIGAVGVFIAFAQQTRLSHNLIDHINYSGVSCGFAWDSNPTNMSSTQIDYNYIYDVMMGLHDGGGVYTLGSQPNTSVHHNVVRDSVSSLSHGLYADQGSRYIVFENNQVFRCGGTPFMINWGLDLTFHNNIFAIAITHCSTATALTAGR